MIRRTFTLTAFLLVTLAACSQGAPSKKAVSAAITSIPTSVAPVTVTAPTITLPTVTTKVPKAASTSATSMPLRQADHESESAVTGTPVEQIKGLELPDGRTAMLDQSAAAFLDVFYRPENDDAGGHPISSPMWQMNQGVFALVDEAGTPVDTADDQFVGFVITSDTPGEYLGVSGVGTGMTMMQLQGKVSGLEPGHFGSQPALVGTAGGGTIYFASSCNPEEVAMIVLATNEGMNLVGQHFGVGCHGGGE